MMLGLETSSCYFVFLLYNDCLPFFFFFSTSSFLPVLGLSILFLNCIAMAPPGSKYTFIYLHANTYFSFEIM